ncbi:MAG TPA: DUF177 domain-containing protein [Acidimicrobiia bacterium]|nr:DUF177 domain-containing protein [Acidimicrobiia bacterium]
MSSANPLRISVADLLRRPGATRSVDIDAPVTGLDNGVAVVGPGEPVHVGVTLERISEGIVVRGDVDVTWRAECSRCVKPIAGTISVHVDELYEPNPLAGETYGLDDDILDLEPMVRDAVALELPAAPLCRDDCAGLCPRCGADHNETACDCVVDETDSRWAALRSLEI